MSTLEIKVANTLDAVENFSQFLEYETKALATADYQTFASIQDTKILLAQQYQDAILAFEADLPHLHALNETLKDKLRNMHQRYLKASEANQKALVAAKNVTERMVNLIMTAAKQTVMDGPTYSAVGVQGISDKLPIHFKLNEVL